MLGDQNHNCYQKDFSQQKPVNNVHKNISVQNKLFFWYRTINIF